MTDPRNMSLAELQAELHHQACLQGVQTTSLLRVALQNYLYPNSDTFTTSPKLADPDA